MPTATLRAFLHPFLVKNLYEKNISNKYCREKQNHTFKSNTQFPWIFPFLYRKLNSSDNMHRPYISESAHPTVNRGLLTQKQKRMKSLLS
jgi:hypothetical protein